MSIHAKEVRAVILGSRPSGARRVVGSLSVLACASLGGPVHSADAPAWLEPYRAPAQHLIAAARADDFAWQRLAEMTDTFGPRLSGSPALDAAIAWAAAEMRKDGLENVRLEPVMVPRWMRGRESAEIVQPFPSPLVMLGLGGSVGTGPQGLEAEVLVVRSFDDLEAHSAEAKGRIVFFNVPFTNYGETVRYRGDGASRAARHGAVAVLIRSVGPMGLRTPHTGAMNYAEDAPKIPAAALSAEDANRLQRIHDRGQRLVVRLLMEARHEADAPSANLIGEIRGREKPDEIVLLGGHIDSWDPGTGALDDAGGCVATWEVLRLVKKLGLQPRRTLRVVLFTNEENGLRGGLAYRDAHATEDHVLALESDGGVFPPTGFGFSGPDAARATVETIAKLLAPLGADKVGPRGGGADIGPVVRAKQVPSMSPDGDEERYFLMHHTPADTLERIEPDEIARHVAALAVMAYVVADLPGRLAP
jgi:carboxypeptidase Q